jgi:hypothetical protein
MQQVASVRTFVILVAVVVAACGRNPMPVDHGADASNGGDGSMQNQCDGRSVSFQHDVVPLIGHCGGEMCHGGIGQSWPYASLVNRKADQCSDGRMFVKPGDPTNSYLLQKLEGTHMCMGVRMPKAGAPLAAADMVTIADWVCEGAPNN